MNNGLSVAQHVATTFGLLPNIIHYNFPFSCYHTDDMLLYVPESSPGVTNILRRDHNVPIVECGPQQDSLTSKLRPVLKYYMEVYNIPCEDTTIHIARSTDGIGVWRFDKSNYNCVLSIRGSRAEKHMMHIKPNVIYVMYI